MSQKFRRGDVVQIGADTKVVVIGSYSDMFGGSDDTSYMVKSCDTGAASAWHDERNLTLLFHGGGIYIEELEEAQRKRKIVESDLTWIVKNWKRLRFDNIPHASMDKLMSLIGIKRPWGANGEGIDYVYHVRYTLKVLDDILMTGDIDKVKQFIEDFRLKEQSCQTIEQ